MNPQQLLQINPVAISQQPSTVFSSNTAGLLTPNTGTVFDPLSKFFLGISQAKAEKAATERSNQIFDQQQQRLGRRLMLQEQDRTDSKKALSRQTKRQDKKDSRNDLLFNQSQASIAKKQKRDLILQQRADAKYSRSIEALDSSSANEVTKVKALVALRKKVYGDALAGIPDKQIALMPHNELKSLVDAKKPGNVKPFYNKTTGQLEMRSTSDGQLVSTLPADVSLPVRETRQIDKVYKGASPSEITFAQDFVKRKLAESGMDTVPPSLIGMGQVLAQRAHDNQERAFSLGKKISFEHGLRVAYKERGIEITPKKEGFFFDTAGSVSVPSGQ